MSWCREGEASSETSSVEICGASGLDSAEFLSKVNVFFIISEAVFCVLGRSGRALKGPRRIQESQGGPGWPLRGSWASL